MMPNILLRIPTAHCASLAFLAFLTLPACGQNKCSEITPATFENQTFTHRPIRKSPRTTLRDLRTSAEALLSTFGSEFKPVNLKEESVPTWNTSLAAVVPGTPPSGGALPPGLRFPLPPGVNYTRPPRISRVQPAWIEAQQLYAEIKRSNIDPAIKQQLEVQWPWLSSRQAELMAESATIDASWDEIQPKYESALDRLSEEHWRLQDVYREYQRDESAHRTYCGRQLTPSEDLAAARRECAEMARKLDSRLADIKFKADQNVATFRTESARLLVPHNALIVAMNPRVEHWETRLASFTDSAKMALATLQEARRPPTAAECQTAIKILTQYERLAEQRGILLSADRLKALNDLRDSGDIRISHLPGGLKPRFPGIFGDMTLAEIREACRAKP